MPVLGCAMPNKKLAEGCAVTFVPNNLKREVTRRVGTVFARPTVCEKEFGLHTHTVKDELQTICNRHLMETPQPVEDSLAWRTFKKIMRELSRQIGKVRSAPLSAVLKGKTGRRRKRFHNGAAKLRLEGVTRKDARITEMQKLEMYEVNKIPVKEDRGIQYRSVKYNVALAKELHNIEKRLIGLHEDGFHPVMKGATPQQRAERIALASLKYKCPLYLLLDHSRFDAHVCYLLLKEEIAFYKRCRKDSRYLEFLLNLQLKNFGVSKGGIRYKTKGKRMSGDINTGVGNTVLNLAIIKAWLRVSGVKGTIFLDGDDSVVIIEKSDFEKLLPVEEFMLQLGMVTEMDVTDCFWKAEFCQSRPVLVDNTVRYVRNPHKVLATVGQTAENVGKEVIEEVVRASCMCELALNGNCPVISPYCRRLMGEAKTENTRFNPSQLWKAEQYGTKFEVPEENEPTVESRVSFWRAWDIDPSMQHAMENQHIIVGDAQGSAKKRKSKPIKPDEELLEEWSGYNEPECGCGDCPTYGSEEAYSAARLWLK
ncbi:hypothetical protein 2 [Hubei tombus-like virus 13]|uniref:hypothetical protein 2 n=1 Tax=Hubei tombus-like virus 13 TaxID=1923259 RepID=UPI00090AD74A|nr:hypothetical protein 2 [Hubei tombus-like virus 13]APG76577.1 hypothetical protein 2 [Hubei tombus-like virus 13]